MQVIKSALLYVQNHFYSNLNSFGASVVSCELTEHILKWPITVTF